MAYSNAPILLFTYKRLDTLKRAVSALQQNNLAMESDLFIFSDAAKYESDQVAVYKVKNFIKTITGFKSIRIVEAEQNKGLANSIISGVTETINKYGRVIVVEDDLITSKNFLSYMNQALDYYVNHPKIFSITGFTTPIVGLKGNEVYFTQRASSWGWATWKDRWNKVDWEVKDYTAFRKDKVMRNKFNKMGSDMASMLDRQMQGVINSWAIRWCYHQFRNELYTVHPAISKINNIGFGNSDATHTKEKMNRFKTEIDHTNNSEYIFSNNVTLDEKIIKQFTKPYSIAERIKYKILNTLLRFK